MAKAVCAAEGNLESLIIPSCSGSIGFDVIPLCDSNVSIDYFVKHYKFGLLSSMLK